jgi:thiamine biosynthesis protein ThiS
MNSDTLITVTINGEQRDVAAGGTIIDLLRDLDLHPQLIVVEYNREILDRELYASTQVRAGDAFELVHFVGGG